MDVLVAVSVALHGLGSGGSHSGFTAPKECPSCVKTLWRVQEAYDGQQGTFVAVTLGLTADSNTNELRNVRRGYAAMPC